MDVLARGRTLDARFRLAEPLGDGGVGELWLVDDLELGDEVVAKFVPAGAPVDGVERLKAACRAARRLRHPDVPLLDFHRSGDLAFVTTPYAEDGDVEGFSRLVEDLLAGRAVPEELEKLTSAVLGRESGEPRSLPPRKIVVKPPPRVTRQAPDVGPVSRGGSDRGGGGRRWLTVATFIALLGLAFVVVFLLPDWVEQGRVAPVAAVPSSEPESAAPEAIVSSSLEDLASSKTRAEEARERASSLADALEARGAPEWAGEDFRAARRTLDEAGALMESRSYAQAASSFASAREALETIRARAGGIAAEAVRRGEGALAEGRSAAARESFTAAVRIEPENAAAKRGLRRAETLDEVLGLLASGEERERASDLKGAAELYRKAAALDPMSSAAASALRRVDEAASDHAFRDAMSEGMKALEAGDHAGARAAFERASAVRPDAPEVASALSRTAEAERLEKIAGHRERGGRYESEGAWRKAEAEYRAVLDIDPTIRFAVEGAERAARYAELHEKLDYQLAHPERLSDERALEEASELASKAARSNPGGASLERKAGELARLVERYSTLVPVHLVSDNETEITVYRVGRLGKFERRALELRPGTYTVVGSREGYRDVRHEIVVRADAAPEPVLVRCEEKI